METTEEENIKNVYEKGKQEQLGDEIEFLSFVLTGKGYTKEYYIGMLETRLNKLSRDIIILNKKED